ncbi:MAG TPA: hypothetical protein VGK65_01630 [Candidatus Binatia bacterium]|jgi:hypothetical protein
MAENIRVFDCDGHIIESIPEMVPFLDPVDREIALRPSRNRQGVFAGLDAIHYPRNVHKSGEVEAPRRPRVDASDHRKGSGEDWVAFLEKAGVSETVLFPSEGLSVGFFNRPTTPCGCAEPSMIMSRNVTDKSINGSIRWASSPCRM